MGLIKNSAVDRAYIFPRTYNAAAAAAADAHLAEKYTAEAYCRERDREKSIKFNKP